ncbi:MAG: plasmid pRiA4b ORF-3 family protein [Streptosporangiaceae bacterium]
MDDAVLSDAARFALDSPVVTQAVALGRWIAESGPRPVTPREVLRRPDIPVAATVIGVALPEHPRTAADVLALHRPWTLALATGLLRADGGTVTAGPALVTWPPDDPETLEIWLTGLLTVSGLETGSPWDDSSAIDLLVFLTAVQAAADGVPLRDELIEQATQLVERVGMPATAFWPEKRIENTTERLTSFGAIRGGEVTSLGRWAAERLLEKLTEPEAELTAVELIASLADCDEDERDEEAWAWLDAQPDQAEAARQLLTAGALMEPRLRWIAADVVGLLQEEALPVWREMTAVHGMGPHAKFALFTSGAGPEPDEGEWLWLAVESAAVALADKGPDEAITVLAEALSAEQLAADDLEQCLAVVRATDHPSALSLAAAIADFVASAGAEKLSVNECLQLKVSLARWKPPIWRTVLIPAAANLDALHLVIQVLYGWDGDHLHAFRVRRATYSDPSFSLEETRNEYATRVLTALNTGGGKITYEYDFGAGWIHEIALQKRVPREPGTDYPFCVTYSGDSPVEYPDYDSDEEQQPEPFDLEAVNRRLAALGTGRPVEGADLDEYFLSDLDDDPGSWEGIDLEDAFDLPPVLPPVRLPEEAELAAQARRSGLLADLRTLAGEVRKTTVQTAAVNPALLRLAEEAELVERDGEDLAPGENAGWLDDLADDGDTLEAWEYAFASVLDTTLEAADDSGPVVAGDLDLEGHGPVLVTRLFLSRRDGVGITELAGALKDAATADLEAEEAGRQWQEWVDAHGDPLRLLLSQLERLGAVSVSGDAVRLEPLGVHAVRSKLEREHLFVPVLPAPDQMTPDDLVLVWLHGSDDDLQAELASWTDSRGEEQAARELLAFAADGNAVTRTSAIMIVSRLGQPAEPAWREALDRVELRCYAKPQLARLAGLDPEGTDLPAELKPERADIAWLIADAFAPVSRLDLDQEKFPFDFAELSRVSGLEKPDEIFEAMARLDHPDAEGVLTMIGKHVSDKTTAKAARRAAYKASTRRAARR